MFTHSIVIHCNLTTIPKTWFMKICICKYDPQVSTYILILVCIVCTTICPRHPACMAVYLGQRTELITMKTCVCGISHINGSAIWNEKSFVVVKIDFCSLSYSLDGRTATRRDSSLIMHNWRLSWFGRNTRNVVIVTNLFRRKRRKEWTV